MTVGPIENTPGPEGTEELSGPQGGQQNSGHPAWQPILDALPDDALRGIITPHLESWDKGVQDRFQTLQQQYDPWKSVIESADPEYTQQALGILSQLEENPEHVLQVMAQAYGIDLGQGSSGQQQGQQQQQPPLEIEGHEFDPNDPVIARLAQMEGVLGGVAEFIQAQQNSDLEAQQITAYDEYMGNLKTANPGPWNDDVIDAMVANGVDPQEAVKNYQTAVQQAAQQIIKPNTTAPVVMSGNNGGQGLPSERVDPASLNSQDTRKLVEQMLLAANQNND